MAYTRQQFVFFNGVSSVALHVVNNLRQWSELTNRPCTSSNVCLALIGPETWYRILYPLQLYILLGKFVAGEMSGIDTTVAASSVNVVVAVVVDNDNDGLFAALVHDK